MWFVPRKCVCMFYFCVIHELFMHNSWMKKCGGRRQMCKHKNTSHGRKELKEREKNVWISFFALAMNSENSSSVCQENMKWSFLFAGREKWEARLHPPWASSVCLMVRNLGRSSPATISFWLRRSGDDFCIGTSDPMARTWGGTTSIGDGCSSEHCESHSGKKKEKKIISHNWMPVARSYRIPQGPLPLSPSSIIRKIETIRQGGRAKLFGFVSFSIIIYQTERN